MMNIKSETDIPLKKLFIDVHSAMYFYLPLQNADDVPADPNTDIVACVVGSSPDDGEFVTENAFLNIKINYDLSIAFRACMAEKRLA